MSEDKPKHAGGRPSKYKPEFCQQIIDYFADAKMYDEVDLNHYKDGEISWVDKKRFPPILPTLVQFAKIINVCYGTVYDWQCETSDRYKAEFSNAYARAKALQKDFLVQCGLMGLYNSKFAIFTAVNITKMRNKQDHEHSGPDGKPIPVSIVDFGKIDA